ncbi:MAG: membrane protein [Bacteroidetes bacterium]|nr:membrane protein [Bacteroidota bacterium]
MIYWLLRMDTAYLVNQSQKLLKRSKQCVLHKIESKHKTLFFMAKFRFSDLKSYAMVTLGLFIHAFAWTGFLIPSKIVGGGVSGIGTLIYFTTEIPVGITVFAINIVLLLAALKVLGARIGVNTIFGITVVSLFLWLQQMLIKEPLVNDQFMAALIGGLLAGGGLGIAFANGGNSGGTDIIALIITKYRNISMGRVILYFDIVIIASSYFIFKSIETIIYGYVTMAVLAYTIDMVLDGAKQSYQVMIFSKHNEQIGQKLVDEVGRGVTTLYGQGWYKQQNNVLLIIIRKKDKTRVMRIIKEVDPNSFMSIAKVSGVYGQNFEDIKI